MASGKLAGHDTPEKLFAELLGLGLKSGVSRECVLDRSQAELQVEPAGEVWKQERCPKCRHIWRVEEGSLRPAAPCARWPSSAPVAAPAQARERRLCREADFSKVCCVGARLPQLRVSCARCFTSSAGKLRLPALWHPPKTSGNLKKRLSADGRQDGEASEKDRGK
jgi:hypothetical protein